ncbi:hypothetical protein LguiA_012923 [Lonicera macranthoides]
MSRLVNWLTLRSIITHKDLELGFGPNTKLVDGKETYPMVQTEVSGTKFEYPELRDDSKTLMLVHVSPKEEDLCETFRTSTVVQHNEKSPYHFLILTNKLTLGKQEARVQKEVSMNNLQQKMKQIEDKRNEVSTEIRKLNEKLENITRTSSTPNEAPHIPTEVPQSSTENFERAATARSSNVPRFMMPTVSSKRKTGINQQISEGQKELNQARRRKSSSRRAESVSFPIKGTTSECNSEGSVSRVSRASCLVDLSGKNYNNVDNETECSQDTWDCDIKTEDNKSQRSSSSRQHMAHLSLKEGNNGNGNTNKIIPSKFLKVNHWLHLHKNSTTTTSHYTPRNKRVPANPPPKKKKKNSMEMKTVDKLQDTELYDRKKKHEHDNIKNLTDVIPTVLKNPFPTSGCITMKNDLTNDSSIEGSKLTATMQVIADERQCSETFTSNTSLTCNFTGLVADNGILDLIGNELNIHHEEKVPTEIGTSRKEEELHIAAQNSDAGNTEFLYKLKSQRCLFPMDKANQRDLGSQYCILFCLLLGQGVADDLDVDKMSIISFFCSLCQGRAFAGCVVHGDMDVKAR